MILTTASVALPCAGLAQTTSLDPLTCLLVPVRTSAIGSDRGGIVSSVPAARAVWVEAGALLVQLDDGLAQSDLAIAETTKAALASRLDRVRALAEQNVMSRDDIDALRTDLAIATLQAARAALQVARARVTAPFAGYVTDLKVETGELIGNEPLLTLMDMRSLKAELVFAADAFGQFAPDQSVNIAVPLVGRTAPGRVLSVDPFLDAASNTFSVIAEIDNADLAIPAGASCQLVR